MTAASPKTSPSALRSPLPSSITHSTRPPSVSPRASRSCSSSVQTTALSVEPSRTPSGTLPPARVNPQDDDHRLLGHHDAVHEQRHHLEPVQAPREMLVPPLPSPPHHR